MEQQTVSLKQCISEITGRQIVMNGEDFIYLDDMSKVSSEVILELESLFLQKNKDNKTIQINEECEITIISGFPSSALGTFHTYQSDRDDQINLMGLVTAGLDDLLKCGFKNEDETITWEWKPHTKEQLKSAFDDGSTYKKQQLVKATNLKNQIATAKTIEELTKIVW